MNFAFSTWPIVFSSLIPLLQINVAEKLDRAPYPHPASPHFRVASVKVNHSTSQTATFFNSMLELAIR